MTNCIHSEENAERIKTIIEIAQKRFGLYGFQKTAMREIAEDLGMSKGSLYYYFPDKENLYRAVIKKEQEEFLVTVRDKISHLDKSSEMLMEYLTLKIFYFSKLANLGRFRLEELIGIKKIMRDLWSDLRKREITIVGEIIEKGIRKGEFEECNTEQIATIFLDLLLGIAKSDFNQKDVIYIEQTDYEGMLEKSMIFIRIFIKGLSK